MMAPTGQHQLLLAALILAAAAVPSPAAAGASFVRSLGSSSGAAAAAARPLRRISTPPVPPPPTPRSPRSDKLHHVAAASGALGALSGWADVAAVPDAVDAVANLGGFLVGAVGGTTTFAAAAGGGGGGAVVSPLSLGDIRPIDAAVASAIGFGVLPLAEAAFNATKELSSSSSSSLKDEDGGGGGFSWRSFLSSAASVSISSSDVFRQTAVHQFFDAVSSAGRVALAVLLVGPTATVLHNLGLWKDDSAVSQFIDAAPAVGFIIWFALSVRSLKRYVLANMATEHPDDYEALGKVSLYDKIIDALIFVATIGFIVDLEGIEVGPGLMSVFTVGGLGTVAVGIASKDVAEQFVGGLLVSAWDAFEEGDEIRLGDGTEGIVSKIGLFETNLRGFDNIVTKIPNSQIVRQRVSNLSRIKRCQVKQTIRYPYSHRHKLSSVLFRIKEEITYSCPKLITDGSRPFRADPYSYQADHIEVIVNCHFEGIPPSGNEYMENRRKVLEAIGRAMDANGVEFALPSLVSFEGRRDQ